MIEFKLNNKQIRAEKWEHNLYVPSETKISKHENEAIG